MDPACVDRVVDGRGDGPQRWANGVAELRALVAAMDHPKDGDEWSDLNYAFHMAMYRAARLPHFAGVAARVLTLIEPYSRVAVKRLEAQQAAQAEHHGMIEALQSRDASSLRLMLERSSTRVRQIMVDWAEGIDVVSLAARPTSEVARAFAERLFPGGDPALEEVD